MASNNPVATFAATFQATFLATFLAPFLAIALTACGGGDTGGGAALVEKPAITAQPANQSVAIGSTATFSVTATGGETLAYQWKKNGSNIPNATSSTYTTPATSMVDSGTAYSVVVSNSAGSVTSNHATLTVTAAQVVPAITTQPAAQTVTPGQTASFSVEATGTAPLRYQWKKNGTDISGATSSTYTIAATMADAGAYSVVVTNTAGTATSKDATLTVTATAEAPAITAQPAAQTVTEGQTATFSVTATGASLGYQWKKGDTDISGANTRTYTTDATAKGDSGAVFTVVVSNSAGSVTSSSATLTVTAAVAPAITTQPLTQTVDPGTTATFTVIATGTPLRYQWQKDGIDISGANSNTYTTPAIVSGDNNAVFTVLVSNSAGTVTSSSAIITVNRYSLVANASGGFYDKTECVKDNSTGLIWEGKTASGDRAASKNYTNYLDSTTVLQSPIGSALSQAQIDDPTNSIGYQKTVVNAGSGVCGFTNWRLPTKDELLGIVDLSQASAPKIDSTWFPNTGVSYYWSSYSTSVSSSYYVGFLYGVAGDSFRDTEHKVRLVRCDPAATCTY